MTTQDDKVKLGGLWKNTDKNGNTYLKGGFTYGTNLVIFTNTYKQKDTEPDYVMYLSSSQKAEASTTDTVPKTTKRTEFDATEEVPF